VKPGLVADLPNEEYHAQTDWLSSTQLKGYLPERYTQGGSQEALDFGTLFHTVVLEPDHLDGYAERNGFAVLDAKKIGVKKDGTAADNPTATTAWKEAVAAAEKDGKRVIHAAEWQRWLDQAFAMRDAVAEHETAASLLFDGEGSNEESAFWIDDSGLQHKARFDRRIPGAIVDLKSTSAKPGEASLTRAVIDYGYDLSAAHYMAVAEGLGLEVQAFALVFVAKEAPHRVTVAELDETFLARGRILRALAIDRHLNAAPAYEGASGYLTLSAPRWARLDEGIPA
jgi:hypothetical protein